MLKIKFFSKLVILFLSATQFAGCVDRDRSSDTDPFVSSLEFGMSQAEVRALFVSEFRTPRMEAYGASHENNNDDGSITTETFSNDNYRFFPAVPQPRSHFEQYCLQRRACSPTDLMSKLQFDPETQRSLQLEESLLSVFTFTRTRGYLSVIYDENLNLIGIIRYRI